MDDKPEYIVVGQFGRTHGVSGELYINSLTDNPDRFEEGETFWIESEDGWRKIKIISTRFSSNRPIVKLEGIKNLEKAKGYTNLYLYVKDTDLGKLPEDTYYHFDLTGCRVIDSEMKAIGLVVNVERYPASDVLVIESEGGKKYLFPMVGQFLKDVDISNKVIIIDPPEGIFDSSDEN